MSNGISGNKPLPPGASSQSAGDVATPATPAPDQARGADVRDTLDKAGAPRTADGDPTPSRAELVAPTGKSQKATEAGASRGPGELPLALAVDDLITRYEGLSEPARLTLQQAMDRSLKKFG